VLKEIFKKMEIPKGREIPKRREKTVL